ncbi:TetR/AcrR family transcriptional regulator [Haloactinopolyspora sp.]|uniref:TetR/AcrR family transcriptional regulator n=1 Tax=Haloactinopolyspora sp. TaxID=1966353 RepID=UPI0026159650|nr:TetR/AcrR family transcriptional regulator [Haloactinopolyspora sp.]
MAEEPSEESAPGSTERVLTRRERARAATVGEIKQAALSLMREHGTTDFRFSDIARIMGMTAPALYRYFADRDELLTALIVDAYDDLGAAVADRRDQVPRDDPGGRFHLVAQAYRGWARSEPTRFALILGMPVPGYSAPEEGPTTEAARRAMAQLKSLFYDAAEQGLLDEPTFDLDAGPVSQFVDGREDPMKLGDEADLPAVTFQAMVHCWASLHGFVSLEAYGHLDWMPEDVRDALFIASMRHIADSAGLPAPKTTIS